MLFKLESNFKPTGDQPEAIKQLVQGLKDETQKKQLLEVQEFFTRNNKIKKMNFKNCKMNDLMCKTIC